jgi:hypothetical protein
MQNNKDNNYLVFTHILINMRKYWYKYLFVNKYQCLWV